MTLRYHSYAFKGWHGLKTALDQIFIKKWLRKRLISVLARLDCLPYLLRKRLPTRVSDDRSVEEKTYWEGRFLHLQGCSNEGSFRPTHYLTGKHKYGQETAATEGSTEELECDIGIYRRNDTRTEGGADNAKQGEGDHWPPAYLQPKDDYIVIRSLMRWCNDYRVFFSLGKLSFTF